MTQFSPLRSAVSSPLFRTSLIHSTTMSCPQAQSDALVSSFLENATDAYTLVPLLGGGLAYQLSRAGTLTLGARWAGGYGSVFVRLLSMGVGLTGEVITFEGGQRVLQVGLGEADPSLLHWSGENGLGRGFLRSAISLGSLRGAGAFVQGQNLVFQHVFQDSAMILANNLSSRWGLTPPSSSPFSQQFMEAEATLLQMNAGMALAHGMAPQIQGWGRSLELSLSHSPGLERRGEREDPFSWHPQPAVEIVGSPSFESPVRTLNFWMNASDKGGGSLPSLGEAYGRSLQNVARQYLAHLLSLEQRPLLGLGPVVAPRDPPLGLFLNTFLVLGGSLGAHLLSPEIAHASTSMVESAGNGLWLGLISAAGIIGTGVFGMVTKGREGYRDMVLRDTRLAEVRSRFLDAQSGIRDRVRAIREFCELLTERDPVEIQAGLLELLDLAVGPQVLKAAEQYAASPEDEVRILRTMALDAILEQWDNSEPTPAFRLRFAHRLNRFFQNSRDYLRLDLIPAPEHWPENDPRFFPTDFIGNMSILTSEAASPTGYIDINLPLRDLAGRLRRRLGLEGLIVRDPQSEWFNTPGSAVEDWHFHFNEFPGLRRLYTTLSLGMGALGLGLLLKDSVSPLEMAWGIGITALGLGLASVPPLLNRLIVQPERARQSQWRDYLTKNAAYLQAQAEMGINYPFAALAPDRDVSLEAVPRTRVEEFSNVTERGEEQGKSETAQEWEAELDQAIARAEGKVQKKVRRGNE